jgi:hypothetical protein
VKEYSFLTASLAAVTTYTKRDARNTHLQGETENLCKRLLEVRHDTTRMTRTTRT